MFEVGKTYSYEYNGYTRNLRVDFIQHANGKPSIAVGVAMHNGQEVFDFEPVEDFEEYGWSEVES